MLTLKLNNNAVLFDLRNQITNSKTNLVVKSVDYDFATLHKWRQMISKTWLSDPSIVSIDTDEVKNRIVLGVDATKKYDLNRIKTELSSFLIKTDIPKSAVLLKETQPIKAGLRQARRPTGGGLEIHYQNNHGGWHTCTMGLNVRYWHNHHWIDAFLTNAHCTSNQFGVDHTVFFQPWGRVGTEIAIAPEQTTNCPTTHCTYVDAALVAYDSGIQTQGRIGRTALWNQNCSTGSDDCPLDRNHPWFDVQGYNKLQFVGQTLNKVGRSTGWTNGRVARTCVDVTVGNATWLCQNRVEKYPSAPSTPIFMAGDSGSAVFKLQGNRAIVSGLAWGYVIDNGNDGGNSWWYAPWGKITSASWGFHHLYPK